MYVYYPARSPRKVHAAWTEVFGRLADAVLDQIGPLGKADHVPAYATAVSGDALRELTGLTNVGDPDVEARCRTAVADVDAAIDERLPAI